MEVDNFYCDNVTLLYRHFGNFTLDIFRSCYRNEDDAEK